MKISPEYRSKLSAVMAALKKERLPWWHVWRELAQYYIPKRYIWLTTPNERKNYVSKNVDILDSTGTNAGRILAAGMMNGITSPSRPWFKLRIPSFEDDLDQDARAWLDECERRMLRVLAESNFYNALAVMYLDLVFFGTAAVLIYEDHLSVIRCYNLALGEFYLSQDDRLAVNRVAREFPQTVEQLVSRWGVENVSEAVQVKYKAGGANLLEQVMICHIIEPNTGYNYGVPKHFAFREIYYETSSVESDTVLGANGFHSVPGIFPRWEITGNDSYGTGPGLDNLGDTIQLQVETRRKAQSLDYMIRPPTILDQILQNQQTSLLPGGKIYVPSAAQIGAKPVYQIAPPIAEISQDLRDIQIRIQNGFHNDLFQMISQLDTVRSATEIDARREEKLVRLGPVLERFHNEALNPALNRTFEAMQRQNLLPPAPDSIKNQEIEIQYVSILAAAQTAVGVAPTERLLQLVGNMSAVWQDLADLPDVEELVRDYARDIGVKAKGLRSKDAVDKIRQDRAQQADMQQAAAAAPAVQQAAQAGKLLSETQVGGGANALQQLLGG